MKLEVSYWKTDPPAGEWMGFMGKTALSIGLREHYIKGELSVSCEYFPLLSFILCLYPQFDLLHHCPSNPPSHLVPTLTALYLEFPPGCRLGPNTLMLQISEPKYEAQLCLERR